MQAVFYALLFSYIEIVEVKDNERMWC